MDEIPAVPVTVTHGMGTGPDTRPWVTLTVSVGLASFTMSVPEATARELSTMLAGALTDAADAVRRAKLGLVVAGNGHQPAASPLTADEVAVLKRLEGGS